MTQAFEELEREDLRQASEKGCGAASQIIKAVAAVRGWDYGRHRNLYQAVRKLVNETEDEEFRRLFGWQAHFTATFTRASLMSKTLGVTFEM